MDYGLNISASGAQAAMSIQDVYANNLANVTTPGFKPDTPASRQRLAARQEDGLGYLPSNALLERLGGGLQLAPPRTSFEQGSLEETGNDLDFAIQGDGFFVVRSQTSGTADRLRLTRDGRFTLGGGGRLLMESTGMPVLDAQNRPIDLTGTGKITVGADGTISQGGVEVARLRVVDIPDRAKLTKSGNNLFTAPAAAIGSASRAGGKVMQGMREQSSVDSIRAMLDLQEAGRDVQGNLSMITAQDKLLERAITQFGRIA